VGEPGECLVGKCLKRRDAQWVIVFDAHQVEIVEVWVERRSQDGAMCPGADEVTNGGLFGVMPGARA
jgi:hypothetical protein